MSTTKNDQAAAVAGRDMPSRSASTANALWTPYDPYAGPLPPELEGAVRHEVSVQLEKLEKDYAHRIVEFKKSHYVAHAKVKKGDPEWEKAHEAHVEELKKIVEEYKDQVKMLHSTEQDVCGEFIASVSRAVPY